MALTPQEKADVDAAMEDFLSRRRPPEKIRDKLDIAWRLEGQSVVIFEIRPFWRDPSDKIEVPVVKATFVRKSNRWKIYWQRADHAQRGDIGSDPVCLGRRDGSGACGWPVPRRGALQPDPLGDQTLQQP